MKKRQPKASKNQISRENARLLQQIDGLIQENAELRQENEELQRQLAEARKPPENFKKPKKLTDEDVERAKKLRAEGQSHNKIAQEFGVTEGTIRNYLKKAE